MSWTGRTNIERILLRVMLIELFVLPLAGCVPSSDAPQRPSGILDLTGRFVAVEDARVRRQNNRSFSPHQQVTRKGVARDAMILEAPIAVRTPLEGIAGAVELRGFVTPVFNVGDGVQMDILVTNSALATRIYSQYYDAGRRAEDRDWLPLVIPIDLSDTKDKWLEIRVSAGPQGDLTADWLALSSLYITQRHAARGAG